jgi:hypothetical protein
MLLLSALHVCFAASCFSAVLQAFSSAATSFLLQCASYPPPLFTDLAPLLKTFPSTSHHAQVLEDLLGRVAVLRARPSTLDEFMAYQARQTMAS